MTNGHDANGWEREPFGVKGNVRNPEYEFDGPAKWQKPAATLCRTCGGQGCEEGCGRCEMAYAGPDSHKVCRACKGHGR